MAMGLDSGKNKEVCCGGGGGALVLSRLGRKKPKFKALVLPILLLVLLIALSFSVTAYRTGHSGIFLLTFLASSAVGAAIGLYGISLVRNSILNGTIVIRWNGRFEYWRAGALVLFVVGGALVDDFFMSSCMAKPFTNTVEKIDRLYYCQSFLNGSFVGVFLVPITMELLWVAVYERKHKNSLHIAVDRDESGKEDNEP